ncbi:MAG: hypothetical protein Q4C70_14555, partial [Planctomycetia bacterium]|nr:hypothetical protein [Planctomycetia bacterium]
MNGKHILGTVSLLLILNMVGCQGARNTGKDPLLGKTRLDPPATSARSVYIERANIHDSGVVPGNRRTLASAPVTDSENNANSINNSTPNHADPSSTNLSTASGTSRVVRYPTELDGTNTENTKNTENIEKISVYECSDS